jgi:hypothetical protein
LVISEIMYHPSERSDGRNLELVELYNSNPFFEDIGGYRLTGAVDYTFPPNTKLAGRSFAVIAKAPGDVQAVHGISGVFGPFTNNLENGSESCGCGTISMPCFGSDLSATFVSARSRWRRTFSRAIAPITARGIPRHGQRAHCWAVLREVNRIPAIHTGRF